MIVPRATVNRLWFPILLYEVPPGIWLIAKGTEERNAFSLPDENDL